MRTPFIAILPLLSTLTASACIEPEADANDPELAGTEQAVSWSMTTPLYSCTGIGPNTNTCSIPLNVPDDGHHACIINGIEGAITASGFIGGGAVRITGLGGNFQLEIKTGRPFSNENRTVSASAACFTADKVALRSSAWDGGAPVTLASAADSGNMMCFLKTVETTFNAFVDPTDEIFVKKNALGQWQVGGTQGNGAKILVGAQCVRPPGGAAWFYTYGWQGTTFLPLAPNNPPGGVVCGLNRMRGLFELSNAKVSVSYSAIGSQWVMGFGGTYKEGDSYCFN